MVDETYVARPPSALAGRFADSALWRSWFPDLHLSVFMDRGEQGIRWSVSGPVAGSLEVWLEPWCPSGQDRPMGTIVHWYLRVDPIDERGRQPRRAARTRADYSRRIKIRMFAFKDEVEGVRIGGAGTADPQV